jgi:UDP-N-acetylglucosamine transferase subunit ALG13
MDQLAAQLDERVIIQRGSSAYRPRHARHFRFTTGEEMARLTREARIVVSHAAAGAIILALRDGKPLVLVPRSRAHGESLDDHQLELARALAEAGMAVLVTDPAPAPLRQAIRLAGRQKVMPSGSGGLVAALRRQLQAWEQIADRKAGLLRG